LGGLLYFRSKPLKDGLRCVRITFTYILCCMSLLILTTAVSNAQLLQETYIDAGYSHSYNGGIWGGGVSLADFNGDGIDDITLARNGDRPLFIIGGDSTLQLIQLPFPVSGEIKQLCWVDIDQDGDRDLSMSGFNMPFMIFERTGDEQLTALDTASGIASDFIVGYGHSWGDYDRDGDLDVFVCNYDAAYMGYMDADNRLYRNDGDLQFTDVTATAGFPSMVNYTFMALWMDYNRDLYPDLMVLNDRYEVPNYFYHNNGDGTFTEIGQSANLKDFIWSMTATSDDYDNDGDLDIYITNGPEGNVHKRNNGDGTFTNVEEYLGTEVNHFCWSAQFIDLNRDGWQDLHVCSTPIAALEGENFALINDGVLFQDSTSTVGLSNDKGWSRASGVGDFNDDGLADMVVSKSSPDFSTYWKAISNENHWLKVELEGTVSNREGISSWIDAYSGSLHQSRYTYCGEGYLAQNSFSEFFGWGDRALIDSLVVSWPSGIVDRWYTIPANQQLYLVEGTSRRVEVEASNGWSICAGDSTTLQANEWTSYAWQDGSTAMNITVAQPQSEVLRVTDVWGNQFLSDTLVVAASPAIGSITATMIPASCNGEADGSIQWSGSAEWFTMGGETNQQGYFDGLSAGPYFCEVENAYGCRDTFSVEITQPEVFAVSAVLTHCTCADLSDGSVSLNFSGGTPNYVVIGNPPLSGLSAGDYELAAMDANGCAAYYSFTITAPEPLEMACSSAAEWDNQANGSITAAAQGGVFPYTWLLNETLSTDSLWNNLSAGVYLLVLEDANGCSVTNECEVEAAVHLSEIRPNLFSAYPNPVEQGSRWRLVGPTAGCEVVVADALGQNICRWQTGGAEIFSSEPLPPGMYFISVLRDEIPEGTFLLMVK
jgi:hypothetical protein